jgi:hypothetical protein
MSGVGSQLEFLLRVPLLKIVLMLLFKQYNCIISTVTCSIDIDDNFVVITFENYGEKFQFVLRMADMIITRVTLSYNPYPEIKPVERFGNWIKEFGITHSIVPPFLFADKHNSFEYDAKVEKIYNQISTILNNSELIDDIYFIMEYATFDSDRIFPDEFIAMVKTIVATLSSI